jgi:hypothetical protein
MSNLEELLDRVASRMSTEADADTLRRYLEMQLDWRIDLGTLLLMLIALVGVVAIGVWG